MQYEAKYLAGQTQFPKFQWFPNLSHQDVFLFLFFLNDSTRTQLSLLDFLKRSSRKKIYLFISNSEEKIIYIFKHVCKQLLSSLQDT